MSQSNDPEPVPNHSKNHTSIVGCIVVIIVVSLFLWLLIPQVARVQHAAPRMQSANNLKQIGLGIQNYDSAQESLPPQAICDEDGKPLLSWRVAILPYMEEDKIYAEFKLDEPWDSEHNKALIPKMPKIYLHPMKGDGNKGLTYVKAFSGNGSIFDKPVLKDRRWVNRWSYADLEKSPRGTSNLLFCIEAGDPVVWTKPEDWEYDSSQPLPGFKPLFKYGFMALKADGSVISIRKEFKESAFRASLEPNSTSKESLDD